jgi:hypothetical protein
MPARIFSPGAQQNLQFYRFVSWLAGYLLSNPDQVRKVVVKSSHSSNLNKEFS